MGVVGAGKADLRKRGKCGTFTTMDQEKNNQRWVYLGKKVMLISFEKDSLVPFSHELYRNAGHMASAHMEMALRGSVRNSRSESVGMTRWEGRTVSCEQAEDMTGLCAQRLCARRDEPLGPVMDTLTVQKRQGNRTLPQSASAEKDP